MSNRQDSWNEEEDLLLAEVVLSCIKNGKTQLNAFEEVGAKLSRTAAACGFRWNSYVRKQYKAEIETAKQHRKENRKLSKQASLNDIKLKDIEHENEKVDINLQKIIEFLKNLQSTQRTGNDLNHENEQLKKKVKELEKSLGILIEDGNKVEQKFNEIQKDYKVLLNIMEKAHKMAIIGGTK
ncbi:RsfA family transcriptional regulator [Bacillus sp. SM2101]|uniref:RsfA family transcriptional regulator n=1 Tax=Bacillus sp. SM2101 TaxID=2805366 RepID=UPI001BDE6210|nr:RsfA family transcriptional regulator [Bacillus sp. SM2101]